MVRRITTFGSVYDFADLGAAEGGQNEYHEL